MVEMRRLSEKQLNDMLAHADDAQDLVLNGLEFRLPEGYTMERLREKSPMAAALWHDRVVLVRMVGKLRNDVYALIGRVESREEAEERGRTRDRSALQG